MGKLLVLVTGRIAEAMVRRAAERLEAMGFEVRVVVLPIAVAVLATPDLVETWLRRELGEELERVEAVILPGGIAWSCAELAKRLGVRVVKGTKHIDDLVEVVKEVGIDKLSPEVPADELASRYMLRKCSEVLRRVEALAKQAFSVCGVRIPLRPPPFRIVVEVLNVSRRSLDEVVEECERYLEEGADILSLDLHEVSPLEARSMVSKIVSRLGKPVAVDASPHVASEACRGGAEMITSIDAQGIEHLDKSLRWVALVVVPTVVGKPPSDPRGRVELVSRGVEMARKLGFEKIFADPILEPPVVGSVTSSLWSYLELSRRFPEIPLFMGVANVVELMDADSVGMNALLTVLAMEVGASTLLTVEGSAKTRGSVRELRIATHMVSIARELSRPPKDLGLSLLLLKEKRSRDYQVLNEFDSVVEARPRERWELDPLGVFRIFIDRGRRKLCALYVGRKGRILIVGERARDIAYEIVKRGLVSKLDHAAYLGMELAKAEEALRIGRSYVQDEPLFPEIEKALRRLTRDEGDREDGG